MQQTKRLFLLFRLGIIHQDEQQDRPVKLRRCGAGVCPRKYPSFIISSNNAVWKESALQ